MHLVFLQAFEFYMFQELLHLNLFACNFLHQYGFRPLIFSLGHVKAKPSFSTEMCRNTKPEHDVLLPMLRGTAFSEPKIYREFLG